MYRLDGGLQRALASGATLIAPNRQRAVALRQAWAWLQVEAGRSVWSSPDILTWEAWLARELTRRRHESGEGPVLLNPSQQHALWQQVLAEEQGDVEQGTPLRGFASALAQAAAVAREWLPEILGPGPTEESRLLHRALARMDALCAARGVIAPALATTRQLAPLAPVPLCFVGVPRLTPRQQRLAADFASRDAAAGVAVLPLPEPAPAGGATQPPRAVSTSDAAAERAAVARWCRARLELDPRARLLVVNGDARSDAAPLRDAIAAALDDPAGDKVTLEGGAPLTTQPLVAVALDWLDLAGAEIAFEPLSRTLRSPFHRLGNAAECAALELWLRDALPQRCEARALLRLLGAAPPARATAAARLAAALERLRVALAPARLGPREWVERFADALQALGYPGDRSPGSAELQAWQRWEAGLEEFASLQGYGAAVGPEGALRQLRSLVERSQHQAATGDAPVTVSRWRGDPVVGYDGIWVAGLGDSQWPEPPRPDPFLPLAMQREAGHPAATARSRLAAAREQLAAWWCRSGEALVLSHPRSEGDIDIGVPVLLRGWPVEPLEVTAAPPLAPGQGRPSVSEAKLPPLHREGGVLLRGGTKLPELQRECAFRAQAELRLGARGLGAPRVGIDPRLRGELVHRSLEHLWQHVGSSARLRGRPLEAWEGEIEGALEAAFQAPATSGGVPPTARQLARERERCRTLLREALALESGREADFTVESSERREYWEVQGVRLRVRIDRIDRLADGSRVIIDYKTGAGSRLDLLSDTPRPVQLLAYLDHVGGDVAALALLKLVPGASEFRAAEDGRAGLPQGSRGTPQQIEGWPARVSGWQQDVHRLVAAHLAGEAQVAPLPAACQYCELPALCRIDSVRLTAALEPGGEVADTGVEAEQG